MFGLGKNKSSNDGSGFSLEIESENLAMPEIHIKEHGVKAMNVLNADEPKNDVLDAIYSRCSVRQFTDKEIAPEDIKAILKAGMSGPSAVNARDWSFIVVTEKDMLGKMADINGPAADPLRGAKMGMLVCGDVEKSFEKAKDYWIVDGSIAAQNMILAAKSLGIGSVWLGTWPQIERVEGQAKLFGLPDNIKPHSIIAFGYPDAKFEQDKELWDESLAHFNKW